MASTKSRVMSGDLLELYGHSGLVMRAFVRAVSKLQKPSWCFVVKTAYRAPERRIARAHSVASKWIGLNVLYRLRSRSRFFAEQVSVIGQISPFSVCDHGPKWMKMPNLASCHRRTEAAVACLLPLPPGEGWGEGET